MVRCFFRWTRSRHRPYHCIRHHAWLSEGLTSPLMDHEVVCQGWGYENKGWMVLLEFLRQKKYVTFARSTSAAVALTLRPAPPHRVFHVERRRRFTPPSAPAATARTVCSRLRNLCSRCRSTRLYSRRTMQLSVTASSVYSCCAAAALCLPWLFSWLMPLTDTKAVAA